MQVCSITCFYWDKSESNTQLVLFEEIPAFFTLKDFSTLDKDIKNVNNIYVIMLKILNDKVECL